VALMEGLRRFARNRGALLGLTVILLIVALAACAGLLFPRDALRIVGPPELWPLEDERFLLGTDSLGRDIAAMIAHGARASLLIGTSSCLAATLVGVGVGATAGFFGGRIEQGAMFATELFQVVPGLILVLSVVSILGSALPNIIAAIALASWTPIARLTRAEFLSWRGRPFVLACRSVGMGPLRIMFFEFLPTALPPVIVFSSLVVAGAILLESAISFLGLGDPNRASWGRLIGEGRELIRSSWYICAIPGAVIMATVLALNLIGDGLNDALNPKLRDR
jgi:peptide/nickel transport system permease protein